MYPDLSFASFLDGRFNIDGRDHNISPGVKAKVISACHMGDKLLAQYLLTDYEHMMYITPADAKFIVDQVSYGLEINYYDTITSAINISGFYRSRGQKTLSYITYAGKDYKIKKDLYKRMDELTNKHPITNDNKIRGQKREELIAIIKQVTNLNDSICARFGYMFIPRIDIFDDGSISERYL